MWNAMACAVMVLMASMIWPDSARSGRLTGVPSDVAGEGGAAVSLPLLIGLLSVSLRSGMSVTRSLEGVGEAVGGALGGGLCAVADALHRGSSWKDAWKLLLPTGLCMLPAFVFLGILPSVMAFVG